MMNEKIKTRTDRFRRPADFFTREYDSVLLFVGIFLLFYLGMNLVRAQILMENLLEPEYLYQKEYLMDGFWPEELLDRAVDLFSGCGDNCVIRHVYGGVGYTNDFQELQMYLSAEALVKKKKLDGVRWNETPNSVLIEGRLKPRSYLKNGERWIIITGMEFRVYDIIEEDEILAQSVYLNWVNMDEEHRQRCMERLDYTVNEWRNDTVIQLQSLTRFREEVDRFEASYEDCLRELGYFYDYEKLDRRDIFEKMKKFYLFMEIAGIICVFYLTKLWFARRKREYLIRRMLGSGMLRLWGRAMKDAGISTGLAFAGAMLLELLQLGMHIAGKLEAKEVLWTLAGAFLITIGIEFTMFGIQVLGLLHIYPTQGNIESAE